MHRGMDDIMIHDLKLEDFLILFQYLAANILLYPTAWYYRHWEKTKNPTLRIIDLHREKDDVNGWTSDII